MSGRCRPFASRPLTGAQGGHQDCPEEANLKWTYTTLLSARPLHQPLSFLSPPTRGDS
jgi:hypothetical protein